MERVNIYIYMYILWNKGGIVVVEILMHLLGYICSLEVTSPYIGQTHIQKFLNYLLETSSRKLWVQVTLLVCCWLFEVINYVTSICKT